MSTQRPRLSAVVDQFNFDGTISRTQIEKAVPLTDDLDRDDRVDVDELVQEAIDAGLLEVKYDANDYDRQVAPKRPLAFEVVGP